MLNYTVLSSLAAHLPTYQTILAANKAAPSATPEEVALKWPDSTGAICRLYGEGGCKFGPVVTSSFCPDGQKNHIKSAHGAWGRDPSPNMRNSVGGEWKERKRRRPEYRRNLTRWLNPNNNAQNPRRGSNNFGSGDVQRFCSLCVLSEFFD